jgi:hypothetical protein
LFEIIKQATGIYLSINAMLQAPRLRNSWTSFTTAMRLPPDPNGVEKMRGSAKAVVALPGVGGPVRRRRGTKAGQEWASVSISTDGSKSRPKAPTPKMVAYAQSLARGKKVVLPEGYALDFALCRRFLEEHAR